MRLDLATDLLNMTPKTQATKVTMLNYVNIKPFCATKIAIHRVKRQPVEWEKIFVNHTSDKGLSRIHKELQQQQNQKNDLIQKD